MKKLILSICAAMLLVVAPMASIAKPVERTTLKNALLASGSINAIQENQYAQLAQGVKGLKPELSDEEAMAKTKKYINESFYEDLATLLAPYYEEMTDEDCQKVVDMLNSPEIKSFNEKLMTISNENAMQMMSMSSRITGRIIGKVMGTIKSDENEAPIAYDPSPEGYRQKFEQYYEMSGNLESFEASMNGMKNLLADRISADKKEEIDKAIQETIQTLNVNFKGLMHNLMQPSFTEKDFDNYIAVYSSPEMKRFKACALNMSKDIVQIMMQFSPVMIQRIAETEI